MKGNPCLQRGESIPGGGGPVNSTKATAVKKSKADAFAQEIAGVINEMLVGGESLRNIADGLNKAGFKTRKGDEWQAMSVKRVLDRVSALAQAKKTS